MHYQLRTNTLRSHERVRYSSLILSGFTFLFLSKIIYEEVFIRPSTYYEIQINLFIWLNHLLSDWPWFWSNITEIGNAFVFIPLVSYLLIRQPQAWAALFGAVPLSSIFSIVGKYLTAVPRPAAVLPHDQFHILGKVLASHNSFPSGHSITAFAVLTIVVLSHCAVTTGITRRLVFTGGFLIAGLIAISRIAVGAHWPLDVLAGGILGIIGGISGLILAQRYRLWWAWIESRCGQLAIGIVLLLWGGALSMDALLELNSSAVVFWLSALCAISVSALLLNDLLLEKEQANKKIQPSL